MPCPSVRDKMGYVNTNMKTCIDKVLDIVLTNATFYINIGDVAGRAANDWCR